MDTNNMPPATFQVQQDHMRRRKELEAAFKEFHELVSNKVLDENKSAAVKNTEKAVVDRLVRAAVALDEVNVGEGILSLASIAIREQLIVRDRVNHLEYELLKAIRELNLLKEKVDGKKG